MDIAGVGVFVLVGEIDEVNDIVGVLVLVGVLVGNAVGPTFIVLDGVTDGVAAVKKLGVFVFVGVLVGN